MIAESSRLFDRVTDAILDGDEIDWLSVRRQADPRAKRGLATLQAMSACARRPMPGGTERRMPFALVSIVALCLVQAILGLAGYIVGAPDALPIKPIFPIASLLAFSLGALWLLRGARNDPRAAALAGFFLANASAPSLRFIRWLQPFVGASLWPLTALAGDAFLTTLLWRFLRDFPRGHRWDAYDRFMHHGETATRVVAWLLLASNFLATWHSPRAPATAPVFGTLARSHPAGLYWLLLLIPALPALAAAGLRVRSAPSSERRRVTFLVAGLAFGAVPAFLDVVLGYLIPAYERLKSRPDGLSWTATGLYLFVLTIPLSSAYAVRARQALPIHLVVHAAFRYLLARRSVTVLGWLAVSVLAVRVYDERSQPLAEILANPSGQALLFLTGVTIVLLFARERLASAIDRLFTGAADKWQVVALAATTVRRARDVRGLEEALAAAVRHIVPRSQTHLLIPGAAFHVVGSTGPSALGAETALVAMATLSDAPIVAEVGHPSSVVPFLPPAEGEWLSKHGIGLLLPLHDSAGRLVALAAASGKGLVIRGSSELAHLRSLVAATASALSTIVSDESPSEADVCTSCGRLSCDEASRCGCRASRDRALLPVLLNSKFQVSREIGRGRMGVVYEAVDTILNRRVALKILPGISRAGPNLLDEARAMTAVNHPHVALVLGVEIWRETPVLVLEYLEGGTLAERLDAPWPLRELTPVAIALASALTHLHGRGFAHRDLKPTNIGFTSDGSPKLLDFGLARLLSEQGATVSSYLAGTPLYLPPESWATGRVDVQHQDLWAFSVVLFQMAAGIASTHCADFVRRGFPRLMDVRAGVDVGLSQLLESALSPDPAVRPANADALRARLVAVMSHPLDGVHATQEDSWPMG